MKFTLFALLIFISISANFCKSEKISPNDEDTDKAKKYLSDLLNQMSDNLTQICQGLFKDGKYIDGTKVELSKYLLNETARANLMKATEFVYLNQKYWVTSSIKLLIHQTTSIDLNDKEQTRKIFDDLIVILEKIKIGLMNDQRYWDYLNARLYKLMAETVIRPPVLKYLDLIERFQKYLRNSYDWNQRLTSFDLDQISNDLTNLNDDEEKQSEQMISVSFGEMHVILERIRIGLMADKKFLDVFWNKDQWDGLSLYKSRQLLLKANEFVYKYKQYWHKSTESNLLVDKMTWNNNSVNAIDILIEYLNLIEKGSLKEHKRIEAAMANSFKVLINKESRPPVKKFENLKRKYAKYVNKSIDI